jgi:hypothetical protein
MYVFFSNFILFFRFLLLYPLFFRTLIWDYIRPKKHTKITNLDMFGVMREKNYSNESQTTKNYYFVYVWCKNKAFRRFLVRMQSESNLNIYLVLMYLYYVEYHLFVFIYRAFYFWVEKIRSKEFSWCVGSIVKTSSIFAIMFFAFIALSKKEELKENLFTL